MLKPNGDKSRTEQVDVCKGEEKLFYMIMLAFMIFYMIMLAKVKKANDYMKRLQAHRALGRIQEEQPAIAPEPREAVPIDVKSLQKKQILAFFIYNTSTSQ